MKEVLIAGGGLIGLNAAYFLEKAGHKVTIVDKYNFLKNCSAGNAGLIVPSHFVPLASPGIIRQALLWMLNSKSPLSINFKPDIQLVKWGMKFWKASNIHHATKAGPLLLELNNFSKEIYRQLSGENGLEFDYKEKGLLMLCRSPKTFQHEIKTAGEANRLGIKTVVLNKNELKNFEPEVDFDVSGAVYYPEDAIISPGVFTSSLIQYLKSKNVRVITDSELQGFELKGDKVISARSRGEQFTFDELIISAGYASQKIFNSLHINTLLQPGKGYSFVYPFALGVKNPLMLVDARVVVSPYNNYTRFGGMMEIGGNENKVKERRIQGMVESIKRFIPEINLGQSPYNDVWVGMRPCSVDGLPYIGRVGKYKNVIVATGHSMMGVSLAPATGKLVEELVSDKKTSIGLDVFSPDR